MRSRTPGRPNKSFLTNDQRLDIDAGVTQLLGALVIVKDIAGAGESLAVGPFEFGVRCTLNDASVYEGVVTLERSNWETRMTSDRIEDLPIGSSCTVTETGTGGADDTPPAVTVLIVQDGQDSTVTAGFVNRFSAGTISVAKKVDGSAAESDAVKSKSFIVQVTCTVDLDDLAEPVSVYSGILVLHAGETATVSDTSGAPIMLPLGTACFAVETDSEGASSILVDHGTPEAAAIVTAGSPDDLQEMLITVTNTFDAVVRPAKPGASGPLASTGITVVGPLLTVLVLFSAGSLIVFTRRRREY